MSKKENTFYQSNFPMIRIFIQIVSQQNYIIYSHLPASIIATKKKEVQTSSLRVFFNFLYSIISLPTQTVLSCYFYMYRTFANAKSFCGLSHSGIIQHYISSTFYRSFFNILFQKNLCIVCFLQSMQRMHYFITLYLLLYI